MSKITDIFSKLDYFPIPHVFYIKDNEGFRSVSGGIITLIMIFTFFYILYTQSCNYFNNDNPNELTKKEKYSNYSVNFTKNDFFLAVSLSYENENNFDYENFIKVGRIIHNNFINHANHNFHDNEKAYFTNCSRVDFTQYDISDSMKKKIIKEAKCLIFEDFNMNVTEFNGKTTLEITIFYDNNYKDNIIGYSNNDPTKPFKLTLYYQNLISAPSKFNENPVKKTINVNSQYVYTYVTTEYQSTIKTFISIRKGDFLRNSKYKKNFTYFYMDEFDVSQGLFAGNIVSNDNYFTRIFSYRIILADTKEIHILTYTSLFDVFSSLGGTLNVVLAAANLFLGWVQKFEQTEYIINKCFNNDSFFGKKSKTNSLKGFIKSSKSSNISKNTLMQLSPIIGNYKNCISKNSKEEKEESLTDNSKFIKRRSLKFSPSHNKFLIKSSTDDSEIRKSLTAKLSIKEKGKLLNSTIQSEKNHAQLSFFFFKSEKSPYTKLFRMYLGLENIIKWNVEWCAYKYLILSKNMQTIFKYIDLNKLYINEKNIKPFAKNQEEFIKIWNNLTGVNNEEEKKYLGKLEEIIEPFLMK